MPEFHRAALPGDSHLVKELIMELIGINPLFLAGLGGIVVLAVIWLLVQFVFKLTIKVFTIGCLGILLLSLLCAASVYFGGR